MLAGAGVALVAIPQSLAYAELAGLPAHRGLYAAALAPLAAAFFASSPWLQTGPVAVTALMTLGALLALVVGGARVVIGAFGLGWMAFLLSQPVLMGFMAAAALLIVGAQLPGALGIIPPVEGVGLQALWALGHPGGWEPASVCLSLGTLALVFGARRVHPVLPGVLLAAVAGWLFSVLTGYQGPRVGEVPRGLPSFSLSLPWWRLPSLVLPGIVIAMAGFAEAASISRTYATRERRPWNPDREFVSQGVANLASGVVGGFPVGGSFARSSLNYLAGARSRWSGFLSGVLILLFLPFAPVLAPLPRAVLAAIVVAAVLELVRIRPLLGLWRLSPPQAVVGWTTFALTVGLAPHVEQALVLSVLLALGIHVWREVTPSYSAVVKEDSLLLRLQGVLWFGSSPILERALQEHLERAGEARRVILDLGGLGRIDLTGALLLKEIHHDVQKAGMTLELRSVPPRARRLLIQVLGEIPGEEEGGERGSPIAR